MNASQAQVVAAAKALLNVKLPQPVERPPVVKVDGKYVTDNAVYRLFNGRMMYVVPLDNGLWAVAETMRGLQAYLDLRNAEVAAAIAKNDAEIEFRMEVVEEMVAAGIAKHVALNRTANQKGLMDCAREYGVI